MCLLVFRLGVKHEITYLLTFIFIIITSPGLPADWTRPSLLVVCVRVVRTPAPWERRLGRKR